MGGGPHGTLSADRVQDWGMGVLPLGRLHLGPCQWKLCKEPGIRFFPVDLRVEVRFGNRATRTSHSASGGRPAPSDSAETDSPSQELRARHPAARHPETGAPPARPNLIETMNSSLLILATAASLVLGSPTPSAGEAVETRTSASPAVFSWTARDTDHVCGISVLSQISNPGVVDLRRLLDATDEIKQMKRDGIDPNSAQGQALRNAAKRKVRTAADATKDQLGHCSIWKAISHADGREVPDLTQEVLRRL